jgi:hypothetical protein
MPTSSNPPCPAFTRAHFLLRGERPEHSLQATAQRGLLAPLRSPPSVTGESEPLQGRGCTSHAPSADRPRAHLRRRQVASLRTGRAARRTCCAETITTLVESVSCGFYKMLLSTHRLERILYCSALLISTALPAEVEGKLARLSAAQPGRRALTVASSSEAHAWSRQAGAVAQIPNWQLWRLLFLFDAV